MQWIAKLFGLEREATVFCCNIINHAKDLNLHPSFGLFIFPLTGSEFHPITKWYFVVRYGSFRIVFWYKTHFGCHIIMAYPVRNFT